MCVSRISSSVLACFIFGSRLRGRYTYQESIGIHEQHGRIVVDDHRTLDDDLVLVKHRPRAGVDHIREGQILVSISPPKSSRCTRLSTKCFWSTRAHLLSPIDPSMCVSMDAFARCVPMCLEKIVCEKSLSSPTLCALRAEAGETTQHRIEPGVGRCNGTSKLRTQFRRLRILPCRNGDAHHPFSLTYQSTAQT